MHNGLLNINLGKCLYDRIAALFSRVQHFEFRLISSVTFLMCTTKSLCNWNKFKCFFSVQMNFEKPKKLSGAQNRKRQLEKQNAALANSQNITQFLTRGNFVYRMIIKWLKRKFSIEFNFRKKFCAHSQWTWCW